MQRVYIPIPVVILRLIVALFIGCIATLPLLFALNQPWNVRLDVGGFFDSPYLHQFYKPETNVDVTFRWSQPESALVLTGAGSLTMLKLRAHGDQPGQLIALDSGTSSSLLTLRAGWQEIEMLTRADHWSGDVQLNIKTAVQLNQTDSRKRGIVLDWIEVTNVGGTAPFAQILLLGANVALVALTVGWISRRIRWGACVGMIVTGGFITALIADHGAWRLLLTVFSARLLLVLSIGFLLALAIERFLVYLSLRHIAAMSPPLIQALTAIALLAFLLRYSATSHPLIHMLDIHYHVNRAWMVREGQFWELFLPNIDLTPKQWATDITIPYSPFYYLMTVPLTFLPTGGDTLAMLAFGAIVDAMTTLFVALVLLRVGYGGRIAIIAAFLTATLSYGLWWAISWGLFPTLLGQCLALLVTVLWLYLRPNLRQRRVQMTLALVMALSYLAYPTAFLFLSVTWVILVVFLGMRRDPAMQPICWAGILALALALALYYGWHIPSLVSRTFPTAFKALSGSGALKGATESDPPPGIDQLWQILVFRYDPVILVLACIGIILIWLNVFHSQHPELSKVRADFTFFRLILMAWCMVYPIFALLDYYIPIVEKHALHLLPASIMVSAVVLGRWTCYRWGKVITLCILTLVLWQAITAEIHWVAFEFAQEK